MKKICIYTLSFLALIQNLVIADIPPLATLLDYSAPLSFEKEQQALKYQLYLYKHGIQSTFNLISLPLLFGKTKTIYEVSLRQVAAPHFMNNEALQDLGIDQLVNNYATFATTPFGTIGLKNLLLNPLTDYELLNHRLQVLRTLESDPTLCFMIREHLKRFEGTELLRYWNKEDELTQHAEQLFFSSFVNNTMRNWLKKIHISTKSLNKNDRALGIANNLQLGNELMQVVKAMVVGNLVSETAMAIAQQRLPSYITSSGYLLAAPVRRHLPWKSFLSDKDLTQCNFLADGHKFTGGDLASYAQSYFKEVKNPVTFTVACVGFVAGYIGSYDYMQVTSIASAVKNARHLSKTLNDLQAHLVAVSRFIKDTQKLVEHLRQYPHMQHAPGVAALYKLLIIKEDNSVRLNALLDLLATDTFSTVSMSYSKGRVLKAYKILKSCNYELIPLFQALADLDAILAIATLKKASSSDQNQWSFPLFEQGAVHIAATNFWNPLLPSDKAVANSITLGKNGPLNSIFSGPNGGGKSTSMQAVALQVLLAHGWAIVPAQETSMNVFGAMRTYLAPQANISNGQSTFMAEKALMDDITRTINTMMKPIFVMLDEPLRGTFEREAAQRIYAFGENLANAPHCCCIIATHIEKPTLLEQHTAHFTNHHMELIDENGVFSRTFKLLPGAATWWFTDDAKRKQFIDSL